MPYQIKEEQHFVRIVFVGRITRGELLAAMREMEALEAVRTPVPHRLTDVTGIEISEIKAEDIRAVADTRRGQRFANQFRSAIVAPQPAQFGYARVFQALNDHPDIYIEVFRDLDEATAWLTAGVKAK